MLSFDPDRVAYLEAEGWRAYYDRRWGRVLRLLVTLCQDEFQIPFPVSILAAYYATRAAVAWVPINHDARAVQAWYTRFYRLVRRYSGLTFDPVKAGALELEYNDVHRSLVGTADKAPFIDTMVRLHAELFGLTPEQARPSAEQRVLAANLVDRITGNISPNPAADWAEIHAALRRCYRSIQAQLPAAQAGPAVDYAFTTNWHVSAPIQAVWEAIYESDRWPSWWPYVAAVEEIATGDATGVGAVRRYTWTTRLPYRFVFESQVTKVDAPHVLEAHVSGELAGTGQWTLTPNSAGTHVRYEWNVSTTRAWMNAIAPLARPLFAWNHDVVMHAGAQGLSRLLGARVIEH